MDLKDVVCISACRTPMGRFGGTLKSMASCDIGAVPIAAAVKRARIVALVPFVRVYYR